MIKMIILKKQNINNLKFNKKIITIIIYKINKILRNQKKLMRIRIKNRIKYYKHV